MSAKSVRGRRPNSRRRSPMDMILNLLKALAAIASTVKTALELYDRWRKRTRKPDDAE